MLNPDSRTVFLDALRPPDGFEIDAVLATTYTLDLTAMLLAPLSFARLEGFRRAPVPGESNVESIDPFALLKAIRTFAEKTTVFCQSGRISVPAAYHRLHAYLEQSIVQVTPKSDVGVFHPKVWALRMISEQGEIRYRVLCLSRNLTFDSCWDTALVLEGDLDPSRTKAHSANHPLGDFFAALPGLAVGPVSKRSKTDVEQISAELRRIHFELPDDFDAYQFAPIGIENYKGMPFADSRCDRRLVISPFVTDGAIKDLPGEGGTLVSRLEELDELSAEALQHFEKVYVLADAADQLEDEPEQPERASEWSSPPSGLHAKLFVFDEGWNATVWTGSANATTAAFSQNVEFLVGLQGKKSKVGVDPCLEESKGVPTFLSLLQPYLGKGKTEEATNEQKQLEAQLRKVRASLSRVVWRAAAQQGANSSFSLRLASEKSVDLPPGVTVEVRPITLADSFTQPLKVSQSGASVGFETVSFDALTSFFAFDLTLAVHGQEVSEEFVVCAELSGAPENRHARILEGMLSNPEAVLRFLRLLLALDAFDVIEALSEEPGAKGAPKVRVGHQGADAPLLESMLRALAREPARLDVIEQVVNDLTKIEDGAKRLPPGFLAAWEPIRQARVILGRKRS